MTVPILRASLILAAAASAGCGARTEVSAEAGRTVTYGCGDVEIKATFRAAGVELIQGDNALRLPQVVAASGARYADDVGNELWTRGDSARFTQAGQAVRDCEVTRTGD